MDSRRAFISKTALWTLGSALTINIDPNNIIVPSINDDSISWKKIRKCFSISKHDIANLNNGSAGVMPNTVMKKHFEWTAKINAFAPYDIIQEWSGQSSKIMQRLASHMGATSGQLSLVRNTTEAINMVLWGLPFRKKDEVIYADWDYPYVEYSLKHIAKQKQIVLKNINQTPINLSDDEIVDFYKHKITRHTRLIIITWITHREGRIMPIEKIKKLADAHDIEVLVDGAHVTGHIQHNLSKINPDYYATSLHKWLNGPLGSGILYVKDSKINHLQPPLSYPPNTKDENDKFHYLGTRAFQDIMTIDESLNFLELTSIEKKEMRLRELSNYWIEKVKKHETLKILSPQNKYCAINAFTIKSYNLNQLKSTLRDTFNVHVKLSSYTRQKISVIRVSPNIYTSFEELDRFVNGIDSII